MCVPEIFFQESYITLFTAVFQSSHSVAVTNALKVKVSY